MRKLQKGPAFLHRANLPVSCKGGNPASFPRFGASLACFAEGHRKCSTVGIRRRGGMG